MTEVQSECMRAAKITKCSLWASREIRSYLGGVEVIEEG